MILKRSSEEQFRFEGQFDVVPGQMLDVFFDDDFDGFSDENESSRLEKSFVFPRGMNTFQNGRHSVVFSQPDGVEHQ